ncbi:MAG: hypothetical protein EOO41_02995, partial [Methanobacteriota archaeon]
MFVFAVAATSRGLRARCLDSDVWAVFCKRRWGALPAGAATAATSVSATDDGRQSSAAARAVSVPPGSTHHGVAAVYWHWHRSCRLPRSRFTHTGTCIFARSLHTDTAEQDAYTDSASSRDAAALRLPVHAWLGLVHSHDAQLTHPRSLALSESAASLQCGQAPSCAAVHSMDSDDIARSRGEQCERSASALTHVLSTAMLAHGLLHNPSRVDACHGTCCVLPAVGAMQHAAAARAAASAVGGSSFVGVTPVAPGYTSLALATSRAAGHTHSASTASPCTAPADATSRRTSAGSATSCASGGGPDVPFRVCRFGTAAPDCAEHDAGSADHAACAHRPSLHVASPTVLRLKIAVSHTGMNEQPVFFRLADVGARWRNGATTIPLRVASRSHDAPACALMAWNGQPVPADAPPVDGCVLYPFDTVVLSLYAP